VNGAFVPRRPSCQMSDGLGDGGFQDVLSINWSFRWLLEQSKCRYYRRWVRRTMSRPQIFDYRLIRDQMSDLLIACPRRVEREWPPKFYGFHQARMIVHGSTRVVINTFRTIGFLCVENPQDWRHRPEFVASVLPLTLTILECVFTLVYLFEDPAGRSTQYVKAGWRQLWEETQRQQERYGANTIWAEYLRQRLWLLRIPNAPKSLEFLDSPTQYRRHVHARAIDRFSACMPIP
jgi:hypothetical protein